MLLHSQLLIFFVLFISKTSSTSQKQANPLSGKHLRIMVNEVGLILIVRRNATNHIVGIDGVILHYIEALAKMLNFSYTIIPEYTVIFETQPPARSAMSYILDGDIDYLAAIGVPTLSRFKVLDFPASWWEIKYFCIVPYPKKKHNTSASLKPFSFEVWALIGAAAIITILCLRFLVNKHFIFRQSGKFNSRVSNNNNFERTDDFVLGNLVSQGQRLISSRLVVRFVAGAWCVGCFFIVQSYCSTLTSHLMSPNQKPIVNSIQELAHFPDISITVDKNLGLKYILTTAESGNLKLLGDKLNQNPNLLCNSTNDCLTTVIKDGNSAFCTTEYIINSIMVNDFNKKGTCQYFVINDVLCSSSLYTFLSKHSPYTEIISQGILRFKETGLLGKWYSFYTSSAWQCKLGFKNRRDNDLQKLSVMHLISAFVILLCGWFCSVVVYALEKMLWTFRKRSM